MGPEAVAARLRLPVRTVYRLAREKNLFCGQMKVRYLKDVHPVWAFK
jgi:hypothetical protein